MAKIGWDNGVLILPEVAAPSSTSGVGKIYATTGQSVSLLDSTGTDTDLIVSDCSRFNGLLKVLDLTTVVATKD